MATKRKTTRSPRYALFWKGKRVPGMTFRTKEEATTARSLEFLQMEAADISPSAWRRHMTIKKV